MSKLAQQMRSAHRTGQRMGNGNGSCGSLPPATPMSWGAACPPGACTSEGLAASLNRAFAGEKLGCRELPYWVTGVATGAGVVTIAQNSLVTICPTRVMFVQGDGTATPSDAVMSVFEIANQNQIVGDPIPLQMLMNNAYQTIPFVTDCMKAGLPFRIVLTGCLAASNCYIGLFGPAIG